MVALTEVFGLNRSKNPLSYVIRDIERDFISALDDPAYVALIVHGMSKQGKSSLLRSVLPERAHVMLEGNRSTPAESLYREMLNQCNVMLETGTGTKGNGEIEAGLRWFKVKLGLGRSANKESVQVDLSNASSVARVLAGSTEKRLIVIDNFHFLDRNVQQDLSTAIRSFEKYGFKFIVIGTWNSSGYIQTFSPELMGTVKEFSFDQWDAGDLRRVLDQAPMLGVTIEFNVKQSLIHRSVENIALLQELTKNYLSECGVSKTIKEPKKLDDVATVEKVSTAMERRLVKDVTDYFRTIAAIGEPFFQNKTRSYWILQAFLDGQEKEIVRGTDLAALLTRTNDLIKAQ